MVSQNNYLLFQKAEAALLEEKGAKLFGMARILDGHLEGTFEDVLRQNGVSSPASLTREEQISLLSRALYPFTDAVATAFPGAGVGYYARDLDAIITYGPREKFASKVGVAIDEDHIGRKSMQQEREIVGVGSMVRGEIMNCVHPMVRGREVIGYTWANETVEDIYRQIGQGAQRIFFSPNIQPILGLTGLLLFCSQALLLSRSPGGQLTWAALQMQKYLNTFLNSLNIGIIVVNTGGEIVFANRGLGEILNIDLKSLHPGYFKDWHLFLDRLGFREISAIAKDLKRQNKRQYFSRSTLNLPSGRGKDINYLIAFLDSENCPEAGDVSGTVIIFEDLEHTREEEKKMERAGKLATLGEISASIAHEIRNPLAIVLGSFQLLPQRLGDRDFIYSFLRVATQELVRVNNSIEALLDFARFSRPDFNPVDVNRLLDEIVELFSVTLEIQGIKVHRDLALLPTIEADAKQIKQALLNIVLNAVQAMPGGGELKLSTRHHPGDKFLRITVGDTGPGITGEHKPHIFDAFYSTKEKGTGLGLALVHRVIDEHQGIIEFNSGQGRGTTFYLHLPVQQFKVVESGDSQH